MIKSRWLPLVISLILAATLAFWVTDFVRTIIAEPLLYGLWIISLLLKAVPDYLFWAVFIILALYIASKSLSSGPAKSQKSGEILADTRGPVMTWAQMLERNASGDYSRWRLANALSKLTGRLLNQNELIIPESTNGNLGSDEANDRSAVWGYLAAGLKPHWTRPKNRLWPGQKTDPTSPLSLNPEVVVQFLEDQLDS